ncbi:MAG: hypothetical protein H7096_14145 [Flavobacterium sp.]|nr:hypothetical protein [Pedobacter sp.]
MCLETELDTTFNSSEYRTKIESSSDDENENQNYPLYCNFELPNGVYSAYLFRVCLLPEKVSGNKSFHFEYKGKNPSSVMTIPLENCPFDELLPVPKDHLCPTSNTESDLKAKCLLLEYYISGKISEIGMRTGKFGLMVKMNFNLPKFLYN